MKTEMQKLREKIIELKKQLEVSKSDIQIFEAGTFKEALGNCRKSGYKPQTIKEVLFLRKENKIPQNWYDTASVWDRNLGEFRDFTKEELKDLDKTFSISSLSRLYLYGDLNASSYDGDLAGSDSDGRVVGVKVKK